jgi:pimeloyl-ACP methyl ester carboxylesterase
MRLGWTVHLPKVKCNDINVCYEVQGKGFPLVMIQGLAGNMDYWPPKLIEEASKKYRAVIFDNRGAGRTDAPKIEYSMRMFADDTARLMDSLKIQKAHILGASMGGMIAQEFALTYPQRVGKLILWGANCVGSKAVLPAPKISGLMGVASFRTPEGIAENLFQILFTEDFVKGNPGVMKGFTERVMKAPITQDAYMRQAKAIAMWDSYARLPKINAPTLVMHGKKDVANPPENAKILADRIPGAKLVYFEKSAHALAEEFDKVVNTLFEFLA